MTNPDLIELAMRLVQGTNTETATPKPLTATSADHIRSPAEPTVQNPIQVENPPELPNESRGGDLTRIAPAKAKKDAAELAEMILEDLSKVEGCPERGVRVIVYGSNPWNSWLSFGAEAGPVRNKTELQDFCEIITERLKRLYDVE